MIDFPDGPAKGQMMYLRRAPKMLRVVQNTDGKWDALDLIDNEATVDERIFVYRRIGKAAHIHIKFVKQALSGFYMGGEYMLYPHPGEEHVRTTRAWHAWVMANREELGISNGSSGPNGQPAIATDQAAS